MKLAAINTKLGDLTIEKSGYSAEGYPGFVISIVKDGVKHEFAMAEVDQTESKPMLKLHVWDFEHEDPTHSFLFDIKDIEEDKFGFKETYDKKKG